MADELDITSSADGVRFSVHWPPRASHLGADGLAIDTVRAVLGA